MSMVPADALGRAGKDDSRLIPVSLQHAETQFPGEHTPIVSPFSTSQASTLTLNGSSSPISTLLEELLVMIFDDVIMSESSSCQHRRTPAGSWLSPPRHLASVSRAWRSIVFACPRLWRLVHLTPVLSINALKEQLRLSSPFLIHLTVHQWPFRNPVPGSGPFSIIALTAQLQSILSPSDKEGTFPPASQRVGSITIDATESSTFLNFVLQTWTGRGSKFPALRHIVMNGNLCATWSRASFFDGRNAPALERLELSNVVIAHNAYRLPGGIGLNLTTLVWAAPMHKNGSLIVSASCFHHVVSSFPNLATLELHGHVVALEHVALGSLEGSGLTPLTHIRDVRIRGQVFLNPFAALTLFYLLPSARHVAVRGRACSGSYPRRTVMHVIQGLICLPKTFGLLTVLPSLENLELECIDKECAKWKTWCMRELELWREWRETIESSAARVRLQMAIDVVPMDAADEDV